MSWSMSVGQNGLQKNARCKRRGALVVIALVCMMVVAALVGMWATALARQQRQQQELLAQAQAELVAEAAVQRAAAKLALAADYVGERWTLTPETWPDSNLFPSGLEVEIQVGNSPTDRATRSVSVRVMRKQGERWQAVFAKEVTLPAQAGDARENQN